MQIDEEAFLNAYRTQLPQEAARRAVKEYLDQQAAVVVDPPSSVSLTDLLAESDETLKYRVHELWPSEGRVVCSAQRKSGKTTLIGNVIHDLVDGGALFEMYPVEQVSTGSVSLLDFEMSRNMLRSWYRDLAIQRTDSVHVWPLRGLARSFDIRVPEIRSIWADRLRKVETRLLIIDCLAPIFNALGLNENSNSDVGPVLDAIDALLEEVGITDCLVVHHMGHGPERSRGASRLRDWPEVEWFLMRERDHLGTEIDNGQRFFKAYGRDVDVDESQLMFNPVSRRLSMNGHRTRAQLRLDRVDRHAWDAACVVRSACANGELLNSGQVEDRMTSTTNTTERAKALKKATDKKWVKRDKVGTAWMCSVGPEMPSDAQLAWAQTAAGS